MILKSDATHYSATDVYACARSLISFKCVHLLLHTCIICSCFHRIRKLRIETGNWRDLFGKAGVVIFGVVWTHKFKNLKIYVT